MNAFATVDARFSGAWSEVTARVVARDAIAMGYVAAVATIIGFEKPALALAVPYLTLVVGALLCHHDIVISLLNREMRALVPPVQQGDRASWQHRLVTPAVVGGVFLTVPLLLVSLTASRLAIDLAASGQVSAGFGSVARVAPVAGWVGAFCLLLGRLCQIWNVARR